MKPLQRVQGRGLGRDREMIILKEYMEGRKHKLMYGLIRYIRSCSGPASPPCKWRLAYAGSCVISQHDSTPSTQGVVPRFSVAVQVETRRLDVIDSISTPAHKDPRFSVAVQVRTCTGFCVINNLSQPPARESPGRQRYKEPSLVAAAPVRQQQSPGQASSREAEKNIVLYC
jgi:hypothetical protein